jgi:hypothetical protein
MIRAMMKTSTTTSAALFEIGFLTPGLDQCDRGVVLAAPEIEAALRVIEPVAIKSTARPPGAASISLVGATSSWRLSQRIRHSV